MSDFIIDNMQVEGGMTAGNIETNTINVVFGLTAGNVHGNTITGDGNALTNIEHGNLVNVQGGTLGDYYHLTQPEHEILSAGATAFKGTTVGGTALGLVPDDGVIASGNRVLQDDGIWGSIGGAKSMILSFSSNGSPELQSSSTTFTRIAVFLYAGSLAVGPITKMNVNAWAIGNGTVDVRIVDITNANVIAEVAITSELETNIADMGTLINMPVSASVMEIQLQKQGGGVKAAMASIEIEY